MNYYCRRLGLLLKWIDEGGECRGTRGGGGGQGHRALRVEVRGTWEGLQKERVRDT